VLVALAVAVLAALGVIGTADGASTASGAAKANADVRLDDRNQGRLDRLVGFLQDAQNDDGGYGGKLGAESSPVFSAWVGLALAAAGINPHDQRTPNGRRSLADYVAAKGPATFSHGQPVSTEYQRIGMLAVASGDDPRRFGGRDYVGPLLARQATAPWSDGQGDRARSGRPVSAGWFPHAAGGASPGVNDTIFAVIFLAGVRGDATVREPIARAADAIESMQRTDGTWSGFNPGGGANTDMTGAAVQALCAAGRCKGDAVRRALDWLRAAQNPDGGWGSPDMNDLERGESNSGSTPWVVQALWAAGIDPRRWRGSGAGRPDPLDFLASLQRRDGSIRWAHSRDMHPTWMTAYAGPAFAGHPWPIPAPPRAAEVRRRERQEEARRERQRRRARAASRKGEGGVQRDGGGDVVAGGGGRGAGLFTRPQPGSRGATAGGVRDTERDQDRRDGTKGDDGATGTAAASGVGSDGGVQNADRADGDDAGAAGGSTVSGTVVEQPRGTEGTERDEAIAPGLRAAASGTTGTPWATVGIGGLALLCAAAGAIGERRSTGR